MPRDDTGADSETKTVLDRVEAVKTNLNITPRELIADRGYGSGENLTKLKDKEIKTNIPLWNNRLGISFWKEMDGFIFDEEKLQMTCPNGLLMRNITGTNQDAYVFSLTVKTCRACPLREKCLNEYQNKDNRGKTVKVSKYQSIYNEVQAQSMTSEFVNKLRERMWKMEDIFAEAKSHHGMRKARYRGRSKLQAQVYIISTVQNLKRMAQTLSSLFKSILSEISYGVQTPCKMSLIG